MNKTVTAYFDDQQTAQLAVSQAKNRCNQLIQAQYYSFERTTMAVPPEKYADTVVGGIVAPVYLTGPNTPAAEFLGDAPGTVTTATSRYTVELTAPEPECSSLSLLLDSLGGQNIHIH